MSRSIRSVLSRSSPAAAADRVEGGQIKPLEVQVGVRRPAPDVADGLGSLVQIPDGKHHRRAVRGESECGLETQPGVGAGHNAHAPALVRYVFPGPLLLGHSVLLSVHLPAGSLRTRACGRQGKLPAARCGRESPLCWEPAVEHGSHRPERSGSVVHYRDRLLSDRALAGRGSVVGNGSEVGPPRTS